MFAGVGVGLAGAVLWRLARRRQERDITRKAGDPLPLLTPSAQRVERAYRAVSTSEQLGWVDDALVALMVRLRTEKQPVGLIAMRAGQCGVELVLDRRVTPTAPFEACDHDEFSWRLSTTVDRAELQEIGVRYTDQVPYVLSLGDTVEGPMWVCLDRVHHVGVFCPDERVTRAVLSAFAVQATTVPWAEERGVMIIGADGPTRRMLGSTHAQFVARSSDIDVARLTTHRVLIVAFDVDDDLRALIAGEDRERFTTIGPGLGGEIEVEVDPTNMHGRLQPFDVALQTVNATGPTHVAALSDLLPTNADDPGINLEDDHRPTTVGGVDGWEDETPWDDEMPEGADASAAYSWDVPSTEAPEAFDDAYEFDDEFDDADLPEEAATTGNTSAPAAATDIDPNGTPDFDFDAAWNGTAQVGLNKANNGTIDEDNHDPDDDPDGGGGAGGSRGLVDATVTGGDAHATLPGGSTDAGSGGTAEALAILDEVMAPRRVEVSVLGDTPTVRVGEGGRLAPATEEFVVFVALCGPLTRDDVRVALFTDKTVKRDAARTALYRATKAVGDGALVVGKDTIAINTDDVGVDWHRFTRLVEQAHRFERHEDWAAASMLLERALRLVQGVAWRVVPRGMSEWAYQRQLPYAIRDAITDAAVTLARVSLDHTNEPRVATWAARAQALSTGGHSNMELCELALRASLQAGDLGEAARCEEALTAAQNEFGYEPSQMGLELLAACRRMESQRPGGSVASTVK